MSRYHSWISGSLLFFLLISVPFGYARYRNANYRNFRIVKEGELYRSGQLSAEALKRIIHDHGIQTVVTLRFPKNPGDLAPDQKEEDYCSEQQLDYFRLPHKSFWKENGQTAPADANVAAFLKIMDEPKHFPVLIHCFAGKNRTGVFVAIYRMEYDRWSNADAIAELEANGYEDLEEHFDVRGYLETYVPRWKNLRINEEEKVLPDNTRPRAP